MLLMRPIHIAPIEHHQTLRVARTVPNPSSRHRHLFSSSLPHRRKKIRSFLFDHHALQSLNITLCKIPSQLRVNLSNHETSLNIHPSIAMTSSSSLPSKARISVTQVFQPLVWIDSPAPELLFYETPQHQPPHCRYYHWVLQTQSLSAWLHTGNLWLPTGGFNVLTKLHHSLLQNK